MPTSPRLNTLTSFLLLSLAVLGTAAAPRAAALGLTALPGLSPSSPLLTGSSLTSAPTGGAYEAKLAKGTEGQLRQVALHLSKMQGGASIGGFPGFEPPDDDEEYRRKIKNRSYTPEEANHWVKEINNFLRWLVRKNPGMSLEEMLQEQGLTPKQIADFLDALREAYVTADGIKGYGLAEETAGTLESLMKVLGGINDFPAS